MYRCRYFLDQPEPVREDILTASGLVRAQEKVSATLQERAYARAEIWRGERLLGTLVRDALVVG